MIRLRGIGTIVMGCFAGFSLIFLLQTHNRYVHAIGFSYLVSAVVMCVSYLFRNEMTEEKSCLDLFFYGVIAPFVAAMEVIHIIFPDEGKTHMWEE